MRKVSSEKRRQAFTLIELLVVITIILIAASIIMTTGGGNDGTKLSASERIVSGIAKGARGQAILKNSKVRLIIHNDLQSDQDKYLRFFGLIYADPDDPNPSDPTRWIASNQGTYLPEGIYFDPRLSAEALDSTWVDSNEESFEFPRAVATQEGFGESFYYYEFDRNGTMSPSFQNSVLVVRAGTLKQGPAGGRLDIYFDEEDKVELKTAFIFRRIGTTTMVDNPEAIKGSSSQ